MPPEIIKVCGITTPEDALAASRFGATAIGFVFFPGSPRAVRPEQASALSRLVPRHMLRVGVFVDEERERLESIASMVQLDVVQLHGSESPQYCSTLHFPRVWKAIRVASDFDPSALAAYNVEAFLLDTASNDSYGGTGRSFPWAKAQGAKQYGKIIVAGGLDGSNVAEVIRAIDPWGVDASSRLETRPGIKDHNRVKLYVEAANPVK